MQKTKLGIPVGVVGAALFFVGLFGGYVSLLILVGYVLLVEDNMWLRKMSVKAFALVICFSLVFEGISWISSGFSWLASLSNAYLYVSVTGIISKLISLVQLGVNIIEAFVFIILGFKALSQGTIRVPIVDNFLDKYM